jgi:hypothetical protein
MNTLVLIEQSVRLYESQTCSVFLRLQRPIVLGTMAAKDGSFSVLRRWSIKSPNLVCEQPIRTVTDAVIFIDSSIKNLESGCTFMC